MFGVSRSRRAPHHARANARQYFGPALRLDFVSVALASLRLTRGPLSREHAGPRERDQLGVGIRTGSTLLFVSVRNGHKRRADARLTTVKTDKI
jgi:hypothetical protein